MRKVFIIFSLLFCVTHILSGQNISDNSIGLRFGDNDGFGGELSYQKKLNENNRIEINLGYRNHKNYDAFKLTGIYQWVCNIDENLNWYTGFGGGIGSWGYSKGIINVKDEGVFVNAVGNIGIEYKFKAPLMISLDFRPEIEILGDYGRNPDLDIALSLRYQF